MKYFMLLGLLFGKQWQYRKNIHTIPRLSCQWLRFSLYCLEIVYIVTICIFRKAFLSAKEIKTEMC